MALSVTNVASVSRAEVTWLWPGYIPRGALTIIEGDPGSMKTTLTIDLAARITTGGALPQCEDRVEPGNVLLIQDEDLPAATRAKLESAGADLSNVEIYDRTNAASAPFTLPNDVNDLDTHIRERSAQLVVVDPITPFITGSMNSEQAIRRALNPLASVAARTGATILLVRHLTKGGSGAALYRGIGSIGLIALARAALLVARDPGDAERRVLAVTKSSLGAIPSSLAFRMEDNGSGPQVEWLGESQYTAEQLSRTTHSTDQPVLDEAVYLLFSLLGRGPLPARRAIDNAAAEGVSRRTLQRAKAILGVCSRRHGFGPGSRFDWELDEDNPRVRQLRAAEEATGE